MKLECTPKEAADFIEELRNRLKEFNQYREGITWQKENYMLCLQVQMNYT